MKINSFWKMSSTFKPWRSRIGLRGGDATQRKFDKVAIYHKPCMNGAFCPVVFGDEYIRSGLTWGIDDFYMGLQRCMSVYFTEISMDGPRFRTYKSQNGKVVFWGCRHFTLEDICTMMELMEFYYTDKQLRVGNW